MNFKNMPELQYKEGYVLFWMVFLGISILTGSAMWCMVHKSGSYFQRY
jgi:Mg2+ and Co2+ transporter CorA